MDARRRSVSLCAVAVWIAIGLVHEPSSEFAFPASGQDGAADQLSPAAQVVASIEAGRYHAALMIAQRHLQSQREAHGEDHPETLAAANLVGLAHLGKGDAAEARASFERVLQGYRQMHRQPHVLTGETLNNLGVALFYEGRWLDACRVLDQAYAMRKSLLGELHVDTLQSLANLTAAQRRCGQEVPAEYLQWINKHLFAEDDDSVEPEPGDDVDAQDLEFTWEDEFLGNPLRVFWDDRDARSIGPAATSADLFEIWENALPAPQLILVGAVADAMMIEISEEQRTLATVRILERIGQIVPADYAVWLVPWGTIAEIKAEHYGPKHLQSLLAIHNVIASQELGYEAGGHFGLDLEADDWIDEPQQELSPEARVERLLAAVKAVVGREHRLAASMHQNLGIALLRETHRRAEDRQHLQTAFQILESRLGASHPRTAAAAELLGLAAYYVEEYPEAIEHLERATEIHRKVFGNEHVLAAQSLNALGIARYQLAQFQAARECIQQALDIRAAMRGPLDPLTLRSLNDLAVVLKAQGDYAAAVRYLELAVERLTEWERAELKVPEVLFDVAGHLRIMDREVLENNLAVLRFEMGDYDAARRHLEAILRDKPDGWLADEALLNLGSLARLEGRLDEARDLFQRRANRNAFCLLTQHNLGAIARDTGDLQTAAKYLDQVLKQRLDRFGDQHPDVAFSLVASALLDQRRGDYEAAATRLETALEIYATVYGPGNPKTTDVLRMAGENALLAGRPTEAVARLDRALENKLRLADDLLPVLTEAEAIAYVLAHRERDLLLAALAGSDCPETAYEVVWKTRGLATQAIAARQTVIRDDRAKQAAVELQDARRALAAQMLRHYLHNTDEEASPYRDETLLELQQRKERLERRLAEPSPSDRRQRELQRLDSRQFIASLPADIAVVEIVRVKRPVAPAGVPTLTAASDYHAFVLLLAPSTTRPPVARIDLGDSQPIDDAVTAWLQQIGQHQGAVRGPLWTPEPLPVQDPQAADSDPNVTLRRKVWDKIQPHLADRRTVVMIPDGTLARVPWAALPGEKLGTYLIEDDFAIATATYPRQILELLQAEPPSGNRHLLVGGVDYNAAPVEAIDGKILGQCAMTTRGTPGRPHRCWKRLPGTKAEVQSVEQLLPAEEPYLLLTDSAASKAAVLEALPASRFVLLATHGFFAPAQYVSALDSADRRGPADPQILTTIQGLFPRSTFQPSVLASIAGRNPLTLSGIVLAGANREREPNAMGALGDDGILTAEEIAGLRLDATELVVLSACASGLGEVVGGEGVFGLQRAFALAGARTVIASLWHVEDEATQALMTEFYRQWWQNRRGKLEALAHAQRTMLRHYDPEAKQLRQPDDRAEQAAERSRLSPYYWAAFSLSGDWR